MAQDYQPRALFKNNLCCINPSRLATAAHRPHELRRCTSLCIHSARHLALTRDPLETVEKKIWHYGTLSTGRRTDGQATHDPLNLQGSATAAPSIGLSIERER